jgi:hypothetical protein
MATLFRVAMLRAQGADPPGIFPPPTAIGHKQGHAKSVTLPPANGVSRRSGGRLTPL